MEQLKTYTKQYHCNNCDRDFLQTFYFGEVAHQGSCPHCGVSQDQMKYKTGTSLG